MASVDFQNSFMLIILCLCSTFFLFAFFFKKPKNGYDLPPSPPSLPIIGHLHLLLSGSIRKSFQKITSKYGPFLYIRIFNVRMVLVSSASVAYEIFKSNDINVSSRGEVVIDESLVFGSSGLLKAPYGDYWKFVKKLLATKMLGPHALELSRDVRTVELERFYRYLLDKAMKKQSVDIREEAVRLINTTLAKLSMGSSLPEENNAKVSEFTVEFRALSLKLFLARIFHKPLEMLGISLMKKDIMDVSNKFEEVLERILVKHEKKLDEHQGNEIMDALLAASQDENAEYKITRKHIKALYAELFFGASDSTSSTIQWAMAEIINNPKILERLREEIDSVVGKTRLVHETDLPKLPFLQAIINESLRLHPVGPFLPREFKQACKIGGHYIPAGTTLFINVYALMRDPDSWKDPDEFKPERFLVSSRSRQEEEKREQALKFLPFGGGRRSCPGANLAHILLGTAIGMMVQCFDWKIEGGEKVNMEEDPGMDFSLALAHPLQCTPLPRIILNHLPSNLQIPNS